MKTLSITALITLLVVVIFFLVWRMRVNEDIFYEIRQGLIEERILLEAHSDSLRGVIAMRGDSLDLMRSAVLAANAAAYAAQSDLLSSLAQLDSVKNHVPFYEGSDSMLAIDVYRAYLSRTGAVDVQ